MKWIEAPHLENWGRATVSEAELPALVADLNFAPSLARYAPLSDQGGGLGELVVFSRVRLSALSCS